MPLDEWGTKNPNYKHGLFGKRIYGIYFGMVDRCHKPTDCNYPRYGARGITVCDEWRNDKMKFFEWSFANGYADNLSLDRIDNNKGYSPENCRWATRFEQCNNKSTNHYVTINGETHTISEWARITGILKSTLRERIIRGITGEDLLRTPKRKIGGRK